MAPLGQNFLTSRSVAQKMVRVAEVSPKDIVLEIGPGKGILTEELLRAEARVVAVEKDPRLFGFLKEKFASEEKSGKLVLTRADIRDFLGSSRSGRSNRTSETTGRFEHLNKVVANIPYYLTGQLLRLLLPQTKFGAKMLVLMLQKEIARRIVPQTKFGAKGHKMSRLAVSVRVFAEPKIAFYVKKGNFFPQPKVDSAVILLKKGKKNFFREHKISQKAFFELIKAGFRHPRKLVSSNLRGFTPQVEKKLKICEIPPKSRAENLTLENWACFARKS